MILFNTKKRKQAVKDFFAYVESQILATETETKTIEGISRQLKDGYELIDHNEWGIAFENLSTELVEHWVILDRHGISLARKVIELCKIDKKWELDLHRIESPGYKTGSWTLRDAEQAARENKYTFYKPSKEITNHLKIGNLAKLTFEFESSNEEHPSAERMWVIITEINAEKFKGTLDNHPFYIHDLYAGDEINFEHKHIIDHDLDMTEPNLVDKYYNRCIVTSKVLYDNAPINWIYREEPQPSEDDRDYIDTGWRIFSGDETEEYLDNPDNACLVSLGAVLSRDDSFIDLLDSEIGSKFERQSNGKFKKVEE
jgi:uncharacterized protein YegJ (DUF2314 family)